MVPAFTGTLGPEQVFFSSDNAAMGAAINPNTYNASEKVLAYYTQVKMDLLPKLEVLGGVRVERTALAFHTVMPDYFVGKSGTISYTDFLPSLHFKYKISRKKNLRLSYFPAISRAGFFEIIPYNIQGEYFNELGNPYLKHTIAENFDLRYEMYPSPIEQLFAGFFYKKITNPIEVAYIKTGTSSSGLSPANFGVATNFGFEFSAIRYWNKIGITCNYTYTHSRITTNKLYYARDLNGQLTSTVVQQTRPLQGQAPHIANLSLFYKDPDRNVEIQLAGVYSGRNITQVSLYKDLDYWQKGMVTLDLSIEKRIFKKFTLYCKLQNLLNTPVQVEILQPNIYRTGRFELSNQTRNDRILAQKEVYGQSYLFGLRYKF